METKFVKLIDPTVRGVRHRLYQSLGWWLDAPASRRSDGASLLLQERVTAHKANLRGGCRDKWDSEPALLGPLHCPTTLKICAKECSAWNKCDEECSVETGKEIASLQRQLSDTAKKQSC